MFTKYDIEMWFLVRGWVLFIVEPWKFTIAKDVIYIGPIRLIKTGN